MNFIEFVGYVEKSAKRNAPTVQFDDLQGLKIPIIPGIDDNLTTVLNVIVDKTGYTFTGNDYDKTHVTLHALYVAVSLLRFSGDNAERFAVMMELMAVVVGGEMPFVDTSVKVALFILAKLQKNKIGVNTGKVMFILERLLALHSLYAFGKNDVPQSVLELYAAPLTGADISDLDI